MGKKETLNLFLDLADYFSLICRDVDSDDCQTGKCPFAKKVANGILSATDLLKRSQIFR